MTTGRLDGLGEGRVDPRERARMSSRCGEVMLREAAAGMLGCAPGDVDLRRVCPTCGPADHGRPVVVGDSQVAVSLSHSGAWIAVAAARGVPVGIDIEVDTGAELGAGVLDLVLSRAEGDRPPWADATYRPSDILDVWTRKESVLKAYGVGLTVPMALVDLEPGGGRAAVDLPDGRRLATVAAVGTGAGTHCAVAVAADRPVAVRVYARAPFDAADLPGTGS